jgi:hypothetical protein
VSSRLRAAQRSSAVSRLRPNGAINAIEQKREPSNTVRLGLHVQRLIEDILSDAAKRV